MRSRSEAGGDQLLRQLNPAQREAVTTTEGPVLVLAGAGTGKTRVITFRIAYLLRQGVSPENILAVTFTNKAAREMRGRLSEMLTRAPKGLTISTFHSLGVRVLRAEAEAVGLRSDFTIYDTADQISILRPVLREIHGAVTPGDAEAVLRRISLAKNRGLDPEALIAEAEDDHDYLVARAYHRYEDELRAVNSVDFDDLIGLTVRLLSSSPEVRDRYRERFRYILIDEYQDTNGSQYALTRELVGPERNLCVVGDDDQSIYGFRGAELDKILRFERDFPGARVVKLEENYRSTASILGLANAVIAGNPGRHPKALRANLQRGDEVVWTTVPSAEDEVQWVLARIREVHRESRIRYDDIAILLRSAIQARPFEEKLRLRDIPYRLIGGQSWFDRKEIRDAIAYWRVAANPRDDLSLLRIINFPRRGLGAKSTRQLDEFARGLDLPLLDALERVSEGEGEFRASVRTAAGVVARLFRRARERGEQGEYAPMCRELLVDAGYETAIRELYPDALTAQARWNSVTQLTESVERWQKENPGEPFAAYLEGLALQGQDDETDESQQHGVRLMTLHSAKGLEFPVVFLVGLEEDLLPHRKSIEDGEHAIEEERRLLYVGITRARRRLWLTSAANRRMWGKERPRKPCRFLSELDDGTLLVASRYEPAAEASTDEVQSFLDEYRRRAAGGEA